MILSRLVRPFVHSPAQATTVIATVALGIAALTAAFGVADAALWREPPFADASRLVLVFTTRESDGEPRQIERWSYPRLQLVRSRASHLEAIANFTPTALAITGTDVTEPVRGEVVSPEYFSTLAAAPLFGRAFAPDEDRVPGAHPLVVLSYDLWQRRFGSDRGVLGRAIGLNGQPLTVIGVMPEGFRGLSNEAQLWVPTTMAPVLSYAEYLTTNQNFISVVARARAGASLAAIREELSRLGAEAFRAFPHEDATPSSRSSATAETLNTTRVSPDVRRAVLILFAAVGLLYLLACANATSLLLGRAVARQREAGIRTALGCGPGALFRRYFGECAVLTALGGAVGVLLAYWASAVVVPMNAWGPRNFYGSIAAFSDPAFGWRSITFGCVATLATIGLVSWGPALSTVRGAWGRHGVALREGPRGASARGLSLRRPGARSAIVMVEAALAVMLLGAGALMLDSFRRMRNADLGVKADNVLTFLLRPSDVRIPPPAAPAFITRVLGEIRAVPGVLSASVDGGAPLSGSASSALRIVGQPVPTPEQDRIITRHYVASEHFVTLGIPLRAGRLLTEQDRAGQPRVVVISESAARTYWPAGNALGQRVWFAGGSSSNHPDSSAEVVGIVGDVQYQPLDRPPIRASFYTPYQQFTYSWRTYFVRTTGPPEALVSAMRAAVHRVDPDLPLTEVRTMRELFGASWARQRFDAWFYGTFAMLALLLAATGIYGVVAQAVAERSREMGIRMALGARAGGVWRLVVREGMTFPMLGLIVGVAGALSAGGVLRGALYGVTPTDPRVLTIATVLLGVVAFVACAIPARRATRVDPCEVLREE